jgi:excinuclease UvrABC ATPase subunit
MADRITIKGAREHNLKSLDLEIPRDRLVVITGISGSGKSSLAFDTIYAEPGTGRRRQRLVRSRDLGLLHPLQEPARTSRQQLRKPQAVFL